jgi:hypothetical protein
MKKLERLILELPKSFLWMIACFATSENSKTKTLRALR